MNKDEKQELKEQLIKKTKDIGQGFKRSPEQLEEYLAFAARFHQYSHNNLMVIYAQRPFASFVASASAWYAGLPDKNGKPLSEQPIYVKKGEKAMYIWCPVTVNHYSKDGNNWRNVYQLSEDERKDLKAHPEDWQVKKALRFKLGPVFDVGQVDCPKELLPKILGIGVADVPSAQLYRAMCDYCKATLHIPVTEKDFGSITLRGRYLPFSGEIEINSFLEDTQKLSTLIHEMGHSQLHSLSQRVLGKSTTQKELEADMYSLMLEKLCGIETTDARKGHLAQHYNEYIAMQEQLPEEQRTPIDKVFDAVFARYQQSLPDIKTAIDKATVKAKDISQEHSQDFKKNETLKISKI